MYSLFDELLDYFLVITLKMSQTGKQGGVQDEILYCRGYVLSKNIFIKSKMVQSEDIYSSNLN